MQRKYGSPERGDPSYFLLSILALITAVTRALDEVLYIYISEAGDLPYLSSIYHATIFLNEVFFSSD